MKAIKLFGGGTNLGKNVRFEGITFMLRRQVNNLVLLAVNSETSEKILHLDIDTTTLEYKLKFVPSKVSDIMDVEHLYVIEYLLKSYSLTFGFCMTQVILQLHIPIIDRSEKVVSGTLIRISSEEA